MPPDMCMCAGMLKNFACLSPFVKRLAEYHKEHHYSWQYVLRIPPYMSEGMNELILNRVFEMF